MELGERELEEGTLRYVRRDTGVKGSFPLDRAAEEVPALLGRIQRDLHAKALKFRQDNTHEVSSFAEFQEVLASSGGFITGYFGGSKEDERAIKEATGATPRCFPLADQRTGKCFYTGQEGARRVIFAKAY